MNNDQTRKQNNASNMDLKLKIKGLLKDTGSLMDNELGSVNVIATALKQ